MTTSKKKNSANIIPIKRRVSSLPDRLAMETFIATVGFKEAERLTSDAQFIMFDAWEADTMSEGSSLARKALKLSPLCADAYCFLARNLTPDIAKTYYLCAVDAGLLALGSDANEYKGHYWGFHETRPYMRALANLAEILWLLGEHRTAINYYQLMLELNPNDNQGVRGVLISYLLTLGDNQAAKKLLKDYSDDGLCSMLYAHALLAFREKQTKADSIAQKALKSNEHIPLMLAGLLPLELSDDEYISVGGKDEASAYVMENKKLWESTSGAIEWLVEQSKKN